MEFDATVANNRKLVKQAQEIFGAPLEAAEKKMNELEAEMQVTNIQCIELEEQIR